MIGLNTNVVIRSVVVQDEPAQARRASDVFGELTESDPGYVSTVTMAEVHWVLRRAYQVDAKGLAAVLQGLLEAREAVVAAPDAVRRALTRVSGGADFADGLISALGRAARLQHLLPTQHQPHQEGSHQPLTPPSRTAR